MPLTEECLEKWLSDTGAIATVSAATVHVATVPVAIVATVPVATVLVASTAKLAARKQVAGPVSASQLHSVHPYPPIH